jgi:phosphoketolase
MSLPPLSGAMDPTALGAVAVMYKHISPADLQRALDYKRANPQLMIGQIFVVLNLLSPDTVRKLVKKQQKLRHNPSSKEVCTLLDHVAQQSNLGKQLDALREQVEKKIKQ